MGGAARVGRDGTPGYSVPENPTRDLARRLQLQANVDGRAIIHSTRPRLGPWLIRFQTVVRRLTWWFLEPVLLQVRAFQTDAAQAIAKLSQEQEAMQAQVSELRSLLQQTGATDNSDPREKPGTVEDGNAGQS